MKLSPYYRAAGRDTSVRLRTETEANLEAIVAGMDLEGGRFKAAVAGGYDVGVIAEHKRRSPSDGLIVEGFRDVGWAVKQYQKGGAIAVSVATNGKYFGGSLVDIDTARKATDLPIVRKDFITKRAELLQAKAYGADAVLLIAGGISTDRIKKLQREASNIGLDCLLEIHDRNELFNILDQGIEPDVISINNRNLEKQTVNLGKTTRMIEMVPEHIPVVAEGGYDIAEPDHIDRLRDSGVDSVSVSSSLMRSNDPATALSQWIQPHDITLARA